MDCGGSNPESIGWRFSVIPLRGIEILSRRTLWRDMRLNYPDTHHTAPLKCSSSTSEKGTSSSSLFRGTTSHSRVSQLQRPRKCPQSCVQWRRRQTDADSSGKETNAAALMFPVSNNVLERGGARIAFSSHWEPGGRMTVWLWTSMTSDIGQPAHPLALHHSPASLLLSRQPPMPCPGNLQLYCYRVALRSHCNAVTSEDVKHQGYVYN